MNYAPPNIIIFRTTIADRKENVDKHEETELMEGKTTESENKSKNKEEFLKNIFGKNLLCPISHQIMKDPVIDPSSGRSFERLEIYKWLETSNLSPLTRVPINIDHLVSNVTLKNVIEDVMKNQTQIVNHIKSINLNSTSSNNDTKNNDITNYDETKNVRETTNMISVVDNKQHHNNNNDHKVGAGAAEEHKFIVKRISDYNRNDIDDFMNNQRTALLTLMSQFYVNGKDDFKRLSNVLDCFTGCRYAYDIMPNDNFVPCEYVNRKKALWPNQAVVFAIEDSTRLHLSFDKLRLLHGFSDSVIYPTESIDIIDGNIQYNNTNHAGNGIDHQTGFLQILLKIKTLHIYSARIFVIYSLKSLMYNCQPLSVWMMQHP